ncbi:MAG: TPM domain-containing protein [Christensenellales bacterium]|jgi:uncharacterized protein
MGKGRWTARLWALMALLTVLIAPLAAAAAPSIPSPSTQFYVYDGADVLSADTQRHIVSVASQVAEQTGAQVVVATVPTLNGAALEDYSLAMLRGWGIGDARKNNGVLILLSTGDRVSRIEVGYGLEGALPDGKTGRIQDDYMLPAFRQNDFDTGLRQGFDAVVEQVCQEYEIAVPEGVAHLPVAQDGGGRANPFKPLLIVLAIVGFFLLDGLVFHGALSRVLFYGLLLRGGRGGRGSYGGGGGFGGFSGGGGSGGGGGSSRGF